MSAHNNYDVELLGDNIDKQFKKQFAAMLLKTCTSNCIYSYKQDKLLPNEETCLMNCLAKGYDMESEADEKVKY